MCKATRVGRESREWGDEAGDLFAEGLEYQVKKSELCHVGTRSHQRVLGIVCPLSFLTEPVTASLSRL